MDATYRTPLLDMFRRGEVPADVRMLAARGALAPRAHEQLALLILLVEDSDPAIRDAAGATLARIPRDVLSTFLARADVADEIRAFFAARGIDPMLPAASDVDVALVEPAAEDKPADAGDRGLPLSVLSVTDRMKRAMQGRREERAVLIRDPNRLVAAAVLSSPKLTDAEVEAFARMANVSEEVLRVIGGTRTWVKRYPVASALARNPKTPIAISMPLVPHLVERDVKQIALDRNAPEPLRIAARKVLAAGQARRR